ncbi:glutamyl-tRNA reductase [Candidatus Thioglobus sp.]|mgnify:FL=1|jgi:glutamyl-tRNA reductase|uniref:glutamyl-tRNA reductase n=1 Tax=Candidatus Thioglobus sp. TaxID=2026721 RepID=UPI001D6515B1|nr:glutamyl-tRNA reductase [Candidatus Thioglobus sp.]MBT3276586.1 glutamyl-tRNA reductase [Candidatus Thioglobus sp.]MBT3446683.1 glutamyl-tRNA reductase [Candidatus Thioglobus sp.]MBT4001343.1 glutamyl-tRNA reductase [Candidatus Thioglobus sp.]MBT4182033.1 glutamyl-tRNA reductase [Candidatus Thioglobus sp.]MBT4422490.1 glutamyl-tRNA reductase [Candidatus Thioglobus sp.]
MSRIAILSVNHAQAPVSVRERVAFEPNHLADELQKLNSISGVEACVILSTCNRSEIYTVVDNDNPQEILSQYLSDTHQVSRQELDSYLVYFENDAALEHICNVACGLDSLVLGEPQILGQLKDAYHSAKQAKTLDKKLEKLFQHAFSTAKKVRTDTQIGSSPVSIAYCAVKLSEKIFADLSEQTVLLIGAGEMIELCAQHLSQKGVNNIIVANRTLENAQKIASIYGAQSISLKQFSSVIHQADIIISSTAASVPVIGKGLIESALKRRKHKPMFMLDIAIPRDIEPEVGQLDDVYLYTIDDLEQVVSDNVDSREKEKVLAQEIIVKQAQVFNKWLSVLPNEQLVQSYRTSANQIKDDIVLDAIKRLNNGDDGEKIIKKLADQLTNKILHTTFKNIKQTAHTDLSQCEGCVPNIKK